MTNNNLISITFTEEEVQQIETALTSIEQIISDKVINLTPEERQLYGKLGNRTENWVKRISEYMDQKPELVPIYLDKDEFDRDMKTRETIMPMLRRITGIHESLDDTTKLLSTDIYNASLGYYNNIKLISRQNIPGTTNIAKDLAAQFPRRSKQATISDDTNAIMDTTVDVDSDI